MVKSNEDEFEDWGDEEIKMMKNIGLPKIKLIKLKLYITILMRLPPVGKVLSFSSIIQVATQLNNNKPLGSS